MFCKYYLQINKYIININMQLDKYFYRYYLQINWWFYKYFLKINTYFINIIYKQTNIYVLCFGLLYNTLKIIWKIIIIKNE